jgi:hypothetical protein
MMDATTAPSHLVTRSGLLVALLGGTLLVCAAGLAGIGLLALRIVRGAVRLVWRVGVRRRR